MEETENEETETETVKNGDDVTGVTETASEKSVGGDDALRMVAAVAIQANARNRWAGAALDSRTVVQVHTRRREEEADTGREKEEGHDDST